MGRGGLPAVGAASHGKKRSWPELLGKLFVEAMAVIKAERQDVLIQILHADASPLLGFDKHRVCLFLSDNGIVVRTPVVG